MAYVTASVYRRPMFDPSDRLFLRCLTGASMVGVLVALAFILAPIERRVLSHVEQLPPRFARLILEPKAAPQHAPAVAAVAPSGDRVEAPTGGGGGGGGGPERVVEPSAEPTLPVRVRGRISAPIASGNGVAGRSRAQAEVGAALGLGSSPVSSALDGLASSLQATAGDAAAHAPSTAVIGAGGRGRALRVRAARSGDQLGSISAGLGGGAGSADLASSVVIGSLVPLGAGGGLGGGTGSGFGTGTGEGAGSGSGGGVGSGSGTGIGNGSGGGTGGGSGGGAHRGGSAPGVYRSNASLLAVIQRYAAGIQYCYGNELKRDSSLRGKLVVALTVSAAGDVVEAAILHDSVGSARLASCALSQIRDWKFPAIPTGVTTFQAPFVFTPPS